MRDIKYDKRNFIRNFNGLRIPSRKIDRVNIVYDHGELFPYNGIFEIELKNGDTLYAKRSSEISKPFMFVDEESADAHLDVYKAYRDMEFYSPETELNVTENRKYGVFDITMVLPAYHTKKNYKRRLTNFPESLFQSQKDKILMIAEGKFFNMDTMADYNYGYDGKNLYYIDMHLFKEVPSPLLEDLWINALL